MMIVKICLKKTEMNIKAHLIYTSKDFTGGTGLDCLRALTLGKPPCTCKITAFASGRISGGLYKF